MKVEQLEAEIDSLSAEHSQAVAQMTEDHRRQLDIAKEATDRMLKGATNQFLKDKQDLTSSYEARIKTLQDDHSAAIEQLLTEQKTEMTRILQENLEFKESYELDA